MDAPLEVEVKFHLPEPGLMRDRLLAAGAVSSGRQFETNIRFEDASGGLRERGILLRLRRDDRARLTFKSTPSRPDPQFKVHRELEVVVDDFAICQGILEGLGFHPDQSYEKWRETFVLDHTDCLIDTMPFGVFLEIEGEKPDIRGMANRLGLRWEERILLNYLEIFEIIRQEQGLEFTDITFENFSTVRVEIERYLPVLVANPPNKTDS